MRSYSRVKLCFLIIIYLTIMPIGKSYKTNQVREEIKKLLKSSSCFEYKRNEAGRLLNSLGRSYGYDTPNAIVVELGLDKELKIAPVELKQAK